MKYLGGQEVNVGDELLIEGQYKGIVVYDIDKKQGSAEYPDGSWDYLEKGFMVVDEAIGLVYYDHVSENVVLVKRKSLV